MHFADCVSQDTSNTQKFNQNCVVVIAVIFIVPKLHLQNIMHTRDHIFNQSMSNDDTLSLHTEQLVWKHAKIYFGKLFIFCFCFCFASLGRNVANWNFQEWEISLSFRKKCWNRKKMKFRSSFITCYWNVCHQYFINCIDKIYMLTLYSMSFAKTWHYDVRNFFLNF